MSINLTLLLQIIHFLIAYWILRRFLFAPIVQRLQQQDAERDTLRHRLTEHERNVIKAEEVKRAEWHDYQKTLQSSKPELASPGQFVPPIPSLEHIELSHEQRGELIGQLSKEIAQKVSQA